MSEHLLEGAFFAVQPENINAGDIIPFLLRAARKDDLAVVSGYPRPDFELFGVLETRGERLIRLTDKPQTAKVPYPLCNMGLYYFHHEFLDILASLPATNESIISGLELATSAGRVSVAESRYRFLPLKYPWHLWDHARYLGLAGFGGQRDEAYQGANHAHADRSTKCIVSEGCILGKVSLNNIIMGPRVAVGSGTRTECGPEHHNRETVVIGQDVSIGEDVVLGPGVRIGAGAIISSGARIYADVPETAS